MAAPFGLPPGAATSDFDPSGPTRVRQPPPSSVTMTLPSAIATGPSGNRSPDVISVISGWLMHRSRAFSCGGGQDTGMRIRMEPSDEYMHTLEEASNFNESMYFNVFDPQQKIGGFLRLGNRANEGYAELTTCLYLP